MPIAASNNQKPGFCQKPGLRLEFLVVCDGGLLWDESDREAAIGSASVTTRWDVNDIIYNALIAAGDFVGLLNREITLKVQTPVAQTKGCI
jgi:hypothetical protein